MVSDQAAEIIQIAVAINKGVTGQGIDKKIGIHPAIIEKFLTLN